MQIKYRNAMKNNLVFNFLYPNLIEGETIGDSIIKINPTLIVIFLNPGRNIAVWVFILKLFSCTGCIKMIVPPSAAKLSNSTETNQ